LLCSIGMKLAIADTNESALNDVKKELVKAIGEQNLIAVVCDVSNIEDVRKLRERVFEAWGEVRATINVVPPPSSACGRDTTPPHSSVSLDISVNRFRFF